MVGFAPTAEQEAIRDLAHEVAIEQLRPLARVAEAEGGIPATLLQVLDETGLAAPFPEGPGGSGILDAVTLALVTEELGFGDGGLAVAVVGRWLGQLALSLVGTVEQRQMHLAYRDTAMPIAVALAEEAGGLDPSTVSTTARAVGPAYALDGAKYAVLHGTTARQHIVLANLAPELGPAGLRLFLVPADAQGLVAVADERPLGLRAAPMARLQLSGVRVPADARLGHGGDSATATLRLLSLYVILLSGVAVGISRAALEYSVSYAQTRIQFGRPIAAFQGVAFLGADMAMNLDAAQLMLWRAAAAWDNGDSGWALARAAYRKAHAVATQVTADAIQILGGAGFMEDHPLELWMRDAAALAALGE